MNLSEIAKKINVETPYELQESFDGYWFRYDVIPEGTTTDQFANYIEVKDVLESYGVYLENVQIEHDCITGDLLKIEKETDRMVSTTACDYSVTGEHLQGFTISPIEAKDSVPSRYRVAVYPSGEKVLQAGKAIRKGFDVSWDWEEIETVHVDENGEEMNGNN